VKINYRDLRDARVTAGVPLAQAGRVIGVSGSYVSHVEAGRRELAPEQAERLRAFLAAALRRRAEQAEALADTLSSAQH
jgi:transcriptional regulator with XRE-family HTH domain